MTPLLHHFFSSLYFDYSHSQVQISIDIPHDSFHVQVSRVFKVFLYFFHHCIFHFIDNVLSCWSQLFAAQKPQQGQGCVIHSHCVGYKIIPKCPTRLLTAVEHKLHTDLIQSAGVFIVFFQFTRSEKPQGETRIPAEENDV